VNQNYSAVYIYAILNNKYYVWKKFYYIKYSFIKGCKYIAHHQWRSYTNGSGRRKSFEESARKLIVMVIFWIIKARWRSQKVGSRWVKWHKEVIKKVKYENEGDEIEKWLKLRRLAWNIMEWIN
jgi:hypothetical protein